MAYIVARPDSKWEIRESRVTPAGPRARTLATFRVLTAEALEHARIRSSRPLDVQALRDLAARAGAPVAARSPNQAAGELLAELARGDRPRPALRRLILDAIEPDGARPASDSARAAGRWVTASAERRGETLRDLLLLSDRLPRGREQSRRRFPSIHSTPA
jgi:hypothetical protein